MKFQPNAKYTTISIYALLVLVIAMICFQFLGDIGALFARLSTVIGYVQPVLYGAVFAFLLNPLMRMYDDRLLPRLLAGRMPRPTRKRVLALILTYLTMILLIVAFFALVAPRLVASIASIWYNVPSYFVVIRGWYDGIISYINSYTLEPDSEWANILTMLAQRLNDTAMDLINALYETISRSIGALLAAATSFTTQVVNLLLGMVVSIYILYDREKLFAQLNKIGSAIFPQSVHRLIYEIAQDVNRIFSGFIFGKIIDSLIVGVLCMILTAALQIPYAVLISVIVGVTNVIPYFGPFIGAIPCIVIIFIVNPMKALWFGIMILVLQQLDGNVIGPKILGETVGLSPLWIIFSIMLFSGLLGVMGMFIGVPLFAILYALTKRFIAFLLERKGQPTSTRSYDSRHNKLLR